MIRFLKVSAVIGYICAKTMPTLLDGALSAMVALAATETLWITCMGMFPVLTVSSAVSAAESR
jgi:hypothetical protein